jgi:hypothetical protein
LPALLSTRHCLPTRTAACAPLPLRKGVRFADDHEIVSLAQLESRTADPLDDPCFSGAKPRLAGDHLSGLRRSVRSSRPGSPRRGPSGWFADEAANTGRVKALYRSLRGDIIPPWSPVDGSVG